MSGVIHVLKRSDGRTVYQSGERLLVRFDSEQDRARFETEGRLLSCIARKDITAAAAIVFDALNEGAYDDPDDLLVTIGSDEMRELVRRELVLMIEAALSPMTAQIRDMWTDGPRLVT